MDNIELLVTANIRLVYYIFEQLGKTNAVRRNKDDLISCGFLGLVKAAGSYDASRAKFATYASRCIRNEMFMFLRKNKKTENNVSLDYVINICEDGRELTLAELIGDDNSSFEDEIVLRLHLENVLSKLSGLDKKIMSCKKQDYTQSEIGKELNLSQSYISRRLKGIKIKFLKKC